jgi:hypothetical protein
MTGVSVSKRGLEEILPDAVRNFDACYQQLSVATPAGSILVAAIGGVGPDVVSRRSVSVILNAGGDAPFVAAPRCTDTGARLFAAYFSPVIEELLGMRVSPDYFRYLRQKLERIAPIRYFRPYLTCAPSARMMENQTARLRRE